MSYETWFLLAGGLLVITALIASLVKRLPLTMTMLYLAVGLALGPVGLGLVTLDPYRHAGLLERLAEGAVLISLFTAGLKLRVPLRDARWWVPIRLAWLSMFLTVGLIALAGVYLLGLPLGAAILLGGVLAPTDPVLAADVQLEHAYDRDRLRFGLTAEAGFNDGTAMPFVVLGLGLLGLGETGTGWPHFVWGMAWKTAVGLAIGGALGTATARLFIYLRSTHREAMGRDDFLALGLIALSYGLATLAHAYGFLAVFAAGLALRTIERLETGERPPDNVQAAEAATDPKKAPAHMTLAMVTFNGQVERIVEVLVVLVVGIMLTREMLWRAEAWFIPLLLLGIRPLAVALGLWRSQAGMTQRTLIAWFGIRGIGSLYYITHALSHGLAGPEAHTLLALTLTTIAVSIVVHGISVTPLMTWYDKRARKRGARRRETELQVG